MTKRKYTISDRVLAANRRNLVFARRVDAGVRFRPTPQRAAASRANLVKARAVLRAASLTPDGYPKPVASGEWQVASEDRRNSKIENRQEEEEFKIENSKFKKRTAKLENRNSENSEFQSPSNLPHATCHSPLSSRFSSFDFRKWPDSPSYGTCFTRGLYAVSLRRSARLAGESAAAFDRHVQRFLQALNPKNDGERKLARGIAETVWRRLRVFGAQARWERVGLIYRLREAAALGRWKLETGKWKMDHEKFKMQNGSALTTTGHCRESGNPSFRFPVSNFQFPVSSSAADLALDLGLDIERIFAIDFRLMDAVEKLNARLERLSRRWVEGRGGKGEMFMVTAMPRGRDGELIDLSPAAMGNPFRAPSAVASALECSGGCDSSLLAPFPKLWRRRQWCLPAGPEYRNESNGVSMRYRMMHEAAGSGEGHSLPGGEDVNSPEALGKLWEQAIAGIESASSKVEIQNSKLENGNAKVGNGDSKPGGDSAPGGPGILNFDSLILNLWGRLNHYRDFAQHEAGEVERLLEQKLAGRMSEELMSRLEMLPLGAQLQPSEDGDAGALLMELILLFSRGSDAGFWQQTQQLNEELKAAFYEFLTARFGPAGAGEGLDELMPASAIAATKPERQRAIRELDQWLAEDEAKHNSQFKIQDQCCPIKSRTDSVGCTDRMVVMKRRDSKKPVKSGFFEKS